MQKRTETHEDVNRNVGDLTYRMQFGASKFIYQFWSWAYRPMSKGTEESPASTAGNVSNN